MRRVLAGLLGLLIAANGYGLTINLDYSYAGTFFDTHPAAKATLAKAAQDLGDALSNANAAPLVALTTDRFSGQTGPVTATFDWDITVSDPSDLSQTIMLPTFSYPAGVFTIYAGASSTGLDGDEALGEGGPASGEYELTAEGAGDEVVFESAIHKAENAFNAAMTRGNGPRMYSIADQQELSKSKTVNFTLHVGALAGFLTFAVDNKWQYDYQSPVGDDQFDFYTVMLHEMMHSLGFGSAASWKAKVSGADWSGQHVIDLMGTGKGLIHQFYNEGKPEQKEDGNHIAESVMSKIVGTDIAQSPVMVPDLGVGVRKKLTDLDIAFLLDLDTPAPTPVATATPVPTATPATPASTPVPAPPAPPKLKGKPPKQTTLSKITLKGTLTAPGAYVVYKIGKGSQLKAKGGSNWKIVARLKLGKNTIFIASFDPATGKTSAQKKIVITRQ